jgi:chromate transporter
MKDDSILPTLFVQFAIMALLALGGANAVVPEIHRQAVELRGWMTERQFADMFAISQSLPGPNVMIVTLVGYHVAGILGALVTTLAMCGPTAILAAILRASGIASKTRPGVRSSRLDLCRFRSDSSLQARLCSQMLQSRVGLPASSRRPPLL